MGLGDGGGGGVERGGNPAHSTNGQGRNYGAGQGKGVFQVHGGAVDFRRSILGGRVEGLGLDATMEEDVSDSIVLLLVLAVIVVLAEDWYKHLCTTVIVNDVVGVKHLNHE